MYFLLLTVIVIFSQSGLLLLFSRLIPEFPNSDYFLEAINRDLVGTTVLYYTKLGINCSAD